MKRLYLALFALIVGIVGADTAIAHHNGPFLPGLPTTVIKRAMDRGFVTYRLDQATNVYPNFRVQAEDVVYAGDLALGIPAVETGGKPDIWLTMPDDQTFIDTCGARAAACVTYTADPIFVYFRKALGYADWKTTISHEGINFGHVFGEHEQYDDNTFTCRSKSDLELNGPGLTVMSCGTGLWRPEPFDIATVRAVVMPAELESAALVGNFVWHSGSDSKARRLAVYYETYTGFKYWAGYYISPVPPCNNAWKVCGGHPIPDPGRCQGVWLGTENALPGSWFDGLVLAGWTSCF